MSEIRYVLWTCTEGHDFQAGYDMEFDETGSATSVERTATEEELELECPECGDDELTMKGSSEYKFEDVEEVDE